MNTTSNFSLLLNGLSADADVEITQDLDNNGVINFDDNFIGSSNNGGTTAESISDTLEAGTYYIRVYPFEGATSYNLTLSATP